MSVISKLFDNPALTDDELVLLAEIYRHPTVQKHLKIIGKEAAVELLEVSALDGTTGNDLAVMHSHVSGKLAVVAMLASIPELNPIKE